MRKIGILFLSFFLSVSFLSLQVYVLSNSFFFLTFVFFFSLLSVFLCFFSIFPPLELLPVLGLLEGYMTPTLDAALLSSSRAGSELGSKSDWLRSTITSKFACLDLINKASLLLL